jgi:hypothetical protein
MYRFVVNLIFGFSLISAINHVNRKGQWFPSREELTSRHPFTPAFLAANIAEFSAICTLSCIDNNHVYSTALAIQSLVSPENPLVNCIALDKVVDVLKPHHSKSLSQISLLSYNACLTQN